MQLITQYFNDLSEQQLAQLAQLEALYAEWNAKINVVSRKDFENLYTHHVLHSLSIAKVISIKPERDILDIGTGGGLPGIPLAILFPQARFHLVDSIGKKITVVKAVAEGLGLQNVTAEVGRVEQLPKRYDMAVTRAVAPLSTLHQWVYGKIKQHSKHDVLNGILALKGGDITEEIAPFGDKVTLYPINHYFNEPYFEGKFVVHLKI